MSTSDTRTEEVTQSFIKKIGSKVKAGTDRAKELGSKIVAGAKKNAGFVLDMFRALLGGAMIGAGASVSTLLFGASFEPGFALAYPAIAAFVTANALWIAPALIAGGIITAFGVKWMIPALQSLGTGVRYIALAILKAGSWVLGAVAFVLASLSLVVMGLLLTVYKALWAVALLLQTPALAQQKTATDSWKLYGLSWTPKYFTATTVTQVAARQHVSDSEDAHIKHWAEETVAAEESNVYQHPAQQPKGHATPKHQKRRPAKLPMAPVVDGV